MEFSFLLLFAVIWLLVGLPLNQLKKTAKKAPPRRPAPQVFPAEQDPELPDEPLETEPLGPTLLQPTVSVTGHDDSLYQGSLNAVTGEGTDPCHEEQLSALSASPQEQASPVEAPPALQWNWSGNEIVRGFVMGEILKRR